jgi:hypothetical protein
LSHNPSVKINLEMLERATLMVKAPTQVKINLATENDFSKKRDLYTHQK